MNKKNCNLISQKIQNSKLDVVKKSLYFIIVPVLILIIGIILLTTVGFRQGIDFTGGKTFKVYVNNEAKLEDVNAYNLSESKDYDEIYKKITVVLEKNNVSLVSYQTTKVNLPEYDVYGGQAVQVTYQTNSNSSDSAILRADIVDSFDYADYDAAVSSVDEIPALGYYNWMLGLIAGIMFALIAVIIYMSIRYSRSAIFVLFIQVALDVFMTLGFMLIFRVPVNLTIGIVVLSAFVLSLMNSFVYYTKVKENKKSGIYDNIANSEMANKATKQIAYKKSIFYLVAIAMALIFVIFSVNAVRSVAAGIIFALVTTFYTSCFLLPTFWAVVDKQKKAKKNKI